jgi:hypothetical protein
MTLGHVRALARTFQGLLCGCFYEFAIEYEVILLTCEGRTVRRKSGRFGNGHDSASLSGLRGS